MASATLGLLLIVVLLLPGTTTADDSFPPVFRGCSNDTLPAAALPSLAALASSLAAQSAAARFFQSSTSTAPRLTALFQCRGDLPLPACAACVARLPALWSDLCPLASAARVHLSACYALYRPTASAPPPPASILFRRCSSSSAAAASEEARGQAFARLESAAAAGDDGGFFIARDGGWEATAQCEGDLSVADCGECVTEAVERAEVECGGASGGVMYLDKCFVDYRSGGDDGVLGGGISFTGGNTNAAIAVGARDGEPTQKTVAIVVGGAAGLGFLVIFILFFRSVYKKEEY